MSRKKFDLSHIDTKTIPPVNQRIVELFVMTKESGKTFAKKIGISQSFLTDILYGRAKPSIESLSGIAKYYGISADWILMGEGEKERKTEDADRVEKVIRKDVKLFDIFQILKADQETKNAVYDFLVASKGMERAVKFVKKISTKQIEASLAEDVAEDQKILDIIRLLKKNPQNKDIILKVLEMDMDIDRLWQILQSQLKGKPSGKLSENQNTIYF